MDGCGTDGMEESSDTKGGSRGFKAIETQNVAGKVFEAGGNKVLLHPDKPFRSCASGLAV